MKIPAKALKNLMQNWFDGSVKLFRREIPEGISVRKAAEEAARDPAVAKKTLENFDALYDKFSQQNSFRSVRNIVGDMGTMSQRQTVEEAVEATMRSNETKRVTQIAGRLGMDPVPFNKRLSAIFELQDVKERQNAFRNLRDELSEKASEKQYDKYVNEYEQTILANAAGNDTYIKKTRTRLQNKIGEMKTKPGPATEKRMYVEELAKTNQVLSESISEGVGYNRNRGTLSALAGEHLTDINSKLSNAYVRMAEMGELAAAKNLSYLNSLVKNSRRMAGWGRATLGNAERVLANLDDGGMKVREYVEFKNLDRMEVVDGVQMDRALAQDLGMSTDDVRLANKINNVYRSAAKTKVDTDAGDFSFRHLYKNWKEVPENELVFNDFLGRNDFGHTFWHASPSEESMEKLQREVVGYKADMERNDYFGAQARIYIPRKEFGGLKGDYARRKIPAEEVSEYSYQFFNSLPYLHGKKAIQQIKMSLGIPKKASGQLDDKLKDIKQIEEQWEGFFKKSKTAEQMSKAENIANEVMNLSIPLALTNARLWLTNGFLQPFLNAGPSKGFFNIAKNELLTTGKFAQSTRNIGKGWSEVMDDMFAYDVPGHATAKQKRKAKVFHEFRHNNPDVDAFPNQDIMAHAARVSDDPKIKQRLNQLSQVAMYPFKTTDIVSRHVVLGASMDHLDSKLSKMWKKVKSGQISTDKARIQLERELHLYEFDAISREGIANKIRTNNMAKYKSYDEWMEKNGMDLMYDYSEQSVMTSIFDYSKFGRQKISQDLIRKSPLLAKVFTFRSWPLYYTKLLKSQINAFRNGDRTPLLKTAGAGFTAFALGANAAASDDEYVASYGRYLQGKIPLMSPISFVSGLTENPFGMLEPIAGLGVWAPTKGMQEFAKLMSGKDPNKMTALDFMEMSAWRRMSNTPIVYRGEQLTEIIKELSE